MGSIPVGLTVPYEPCDSPGQGINEGDDKDPDAQDSSEVVPIDPTLSPEILAAQMEHAFRLQDQVQAALAAANSSAAHSHLASIDTQLSQLIESLCLGCDSIGGR